MLELVRRVRIIPLRLVYHPSFIPDSTLLFNSDVCRVVKITFDHVNVDEVRFVNIKNYANLMNLVFDGTEPGIKIRS